MIQSLPRRFSVEEYEHIVSSGVWPEDMRVELIDGEIYEMAAVGRKHVWGVLRLQRRFEAQRDKVILSIQNPLRLETSQPEPDLALLKPPLARYAERLPGGEDVLLIVEVADSSLDYDRNKKLPVYARAGIAEVWIVNVNENRLEVYRHPQEERYGDVTTYTEGTEVAPLALPETPINWWS